MWKKIMSYIFETVDEEPQVELPQPTKDQRTVTSINRITVIDAPVPEPVTVEERKVKVDPLVMTKTVKVDKVAKKKADYEMTAVISPIFGVVEEAKHPEVEHYVNESKSVVPVKTGHLGTVLSPIYGVMGNEKKAVESTDEKVDLSEILSQDVVESKPVTYVVEPVEVVADPVPEPGLSGGHENIEIPSLFDEEWEVPTIETPDIPAFAVEAPEEKPNLDYTAEHPTVYKKFKLFDGE
jgi:hypothetical protein